MLMAWSGAVSIANSVAVWMVMARWREPEEIGRFTIVMSLYMLFFTICSLGLGPFLVNEISKLLNVGDREGARRFSGTAVSSLSIWGIASMLLMAGSGFLASPSGEVTSATALLALAMIPTGAIAGFEALSLSTGKTRLIAFATTVENVLRTIIPVALIVEGLGITAVCGAFVAVRFAALAIYIFAFRKELTPFSLHLPTFANIARNAPTFAGISILASLNWQIVTILLGRLSSETESARYGVASRFLIPAMILMSGYAGVIQPMLAGRTAVRLGTYLSGVMRNLLLPATVAAIAAPFLSPFVLRLLFGENFVAGAPSLDILALTVVPFSAVMIAGRGLVASGAQHIDLIANLIGVGVCLVGGIFLIPANGAVGAATAQFLSLLAMAVFELGFLSRNVLTFRIWPTAGISLAVLLTICFFVWK